MCKALKKAGLVSVKVRRCPLLTKLHKEKRVKFAKEHRDEDWDAWIWTDEKLFEVGGVKGNERIWVDGADRYPDERFVGKVAHPTKIMVWGAICTGGRSAIHFHAENVKSDVYQECIEEALVPSLYDSEYMNLNKKEEYIMMQDGASSHMSKATEAWLVKKLPKKINFTARSEWPPNSPDLNPIETLWSIMQDRVIELKAWTEVELCEVVQKAWWDIPCT